MCTLMSRRAGKSSQLLLQASSKCANVAYYLKCCFNAHVLMTSYLCTSTVQIVTYMIKYVPSEGSKCPNLCVSIYLGSLDHLKLQMDKPGQPNCSGVYL